MNVTSHDHDQFHPEQYFIGLALQACERLVPVTIHHAEHGDIHIDPRNRRFSTTIEDLAQLAHLPVEQFRMLSHHPERVPEMADSRELEELLWTAAWHSSAGRLPKNRSRYDVLELEYWPNLTRLPGSPDIMRLCALLSRKAHSLHLARKLLKVSEEEASRFYCAAHFAGLLRHLEHAVEKEPAEPVAQAAISEVAAMRANVLGNTLRSLWNKLTGK